MEIVKIKAGDLHGAENNVRRHPQKQLDEIKRSYRKFGQYRPLVVTADGEIIVGNGFYEAMVQEGMESFDCIVLPANTSYSDKMKLMLADNKIYDLGMDSLGTIDSLLPSLGDFDIPGYDADVLAQLYSIDDQVVTTVDGHVSQTKADEIKKMEQQRMENPTVDDQAKYELKQAVIDNHATMQVNNGPYITCPHCGTKIYGVQYN